MDVAPTESLASGVLVWVYGVLLIIIIIIIIIKTLQPVT